MDMVTLINNPPEPVITIGAIYTIAKKVTVQGNNHVIITKRMRAVKKYSNVVLFEDERGTRECFTMWELARCIR